MVIKSHLVKGAHQGSPDLRERGGDAFWAVGDSGFSRQEQGDSNVFLSLVLACLVLQGHDDVVSPQPDRADLAPERQLPNALPLVVIPHHALGIGEVRNLQGRG